MDFVEGFILIGGASQRMGTPKSGLKIAGQSFVQIIAGELSAVASRVSVVGKADELNCDLPIVPDIHQAWGALGGLHAALARCTTEWALVVACDLPKVKTSLFDRLLTLRERFDAVAPVQPDGRRQPLCALYRVRNCLHQAQVLIESGERKPIALLQSVTTRWVEFAEIADLPGARDFFDNINTPQDYLRISRDSEQTD